MPKKLNTPEFLKGRATMGMKREFENAVTRNLMERRVKPAKAKTATFNLQDLLPFLQEEHVRWHHVKRGHMQKETSRALRELVTHMNSKKRNLEQVKDLMELNADRPELLDVPEQSESHSASDSEMEPSHAESEQK
jgi:hypothetical protein